MTLKDQICTATDALRTTKIAFARSEASYDDAKAAAITLLTLRQQAELAFAGKVKTKITGAAVAALLR